MIRVIPDDELHVDRDLLREIAEGGTIEVTRGGEVVALLVPPGERSPLTVRRATVRGGFAALPRSRVEASAQSILDDLRSDR